MSRVNKKNNINLKKNIAPILIGIGALKIIFFIMFGFYITEYRDFDYFPAMRDQIDYFYDIKEVKRDWYLTFAPENEFIATKDTLYMRVIGALSAMLPKTVPILYSAMLINYISGIGIAYYSYLISKKYIGDTSLVVLVAVFISPAINAYQFFILRDTIITCLFVMGVYYSVERRYISAIITSVLLADIRFYYSLAIVLCIFMMRSKEERLDHDVRRQTGVTMRVAFMVLMLWAVVYLSGFSWIFSALSEMKPIDLTLSLLSYSFLVTDQTATLAGDEANLVARILMVDSLIIPLIFLVICIKYIKKQIYGKSFVIYTVILYIFTFVIYITVQGNFPFRKLSPLFPLMYITIVCYWAQVLARKNAKETVAKT
jgi:hypothetical protein